MAGLAVFAIALFGLFGLANNDSFRARRTCLAFDCHQNPLLVKLMLKLSSSSGEGTGASFDGHTG